MINNEAKRDGKKPSRGRSLYIVPSDEIQVKGGGGGSGESKKDKELRLAQQVAMLSHQAEAKSSLKSRSASMTSQKMARRTSRAQSDGVALIMQSEGK